MSRQYVSTEFNCRRISVIVHRSASDKLSIDSLVLPVSGLSLISPKEMSQKLPKRSLRDFLFYVIQATSYFRARTIETSSLPNDSMRSLFKQIEIISGILTVSF